MVKHGRIPKNCHFNRPNPLIPWERYQLLVPSKLLDLPDVDGVRYAGVTGLGFSGTNVHMVLSNRPAEEEPARPATLPAQAQESLKQKAAELVQHLDRSSGPELEDLAMTLGAGRSHYNHRYAVLADGRDAVKDALDSLLRDEVSAADCGKQTTSGEQPKIAFLFTGQGSQYPGMGRELDRCHAVFRNSIDRCDQMAAPLMAHPLRRILFPETSEEEHLIQETGNAQPALFVLGYALSRLWQSWGIAPTFLLGHSLGEYTAACVAGVMSLEDALPLVIERARLMQAMDRSGAMHAILAPEQQVTDYMAIHGGEAVIAAFNGPEHVVISGPRQHVEKISSHFRDKGFLVRPLQVSHAFHSPMIWPILDAYGTVLSRIDFKAPRVRLVSNLTGTVAVAEEITQPKYWISHTREAVHFNSSIRTVVNNGCRLFLEVGPHPVLSGMGKRCTDETGIKWLPSLSRGQNDWQCLLGSLAELYCEGMDIDWEAYFKPLNGRRISLPGYPFNKQRFWFSPSGAAPTQLSTMPARGSTFPSPGKG